MAAGRPPLQGGRRQREGEGARTREAGVPDVVAERLHAAAHDGVVVGEDDDGRLERRHDAACHGQHLVQGRARIQRTGAGALDDGPVSKWVLEGDGHGGRAGGELQSDEGWALSCVRTQR